MFRNTWFYFLTVFSTLLILSSEQSFAQQTPSPADLLEYENPRSIALSPDGQHVLLKTRRAVVDSNDHVSTAWKVSTDGNSVTELDLPDRADKFEWFPDSRRIAYLAPSEQGKQVWVKEIGTKSARQVTSHQPGIRDFSLSPDGKKLAYTSMLPPRNVNPKKHNDEKKHNDKWKGVEINQKNFISYQLFSEKLSNSRPRPLTGLWVTNLEEKENIKLSDTLSVEGFKWSPSGDRIAVSATPQSAIGDKRIILRKDLYLFDPQTERLQSLFKGVEAKDDFSGKIVSYSSPFWSPSGEQLGFIRTDHSSIWSAVGEVGIFQLENGQTRYLTSSDDLELHAARYSWMDDDKIHVEFTDKAQRGLFTLSMQNSELRTVYNPKEHAAGFSFDEKGNAVVWVEEKIGNPPEIYFTESSFSDLQKITSLNERYADIWLPKVQNIEWTSDDGTTVQGWLIKPKDEAGDGAAPLLTMVHGGPGATVNNQVEPYSPWLYPIQIFAAQGYAVFMPNYRGTDSFGKNFQKPEAIDQEPVADIVTGIEHLISEGIADKDNLGIMGQSHGGWLGPMVVAEYPHFRAASFAEGMGNLLSLYGQTPGMFNLAIHEKEMSDTTPYENPDRYLELSPAFRDNFIKTTPTLFEFGQKSLAIQGLEMGKGFWRHGTPYELVIYPNTGHNISEPAMKIESMQRNLQWFNRWMKNSESEINKKTD